MSDRRPENLYVVEHHEHDCGMTGCAVVSERRATPADLLAAVRRGVESGEIEGAEHTVSVGDSGELHVSPVLLLDEAQIYLVTPVGGKDV